MPKPTNLIFNSFGSPSGGASTPDVLTSIDTSKLPTSSFYPSLKTLLDDLQTLVTNNLLPKSNMVGKIAEYAGYYLDSSSVVQYDNVSADNGDRDDFPNSPVSLTSQPNKSLHKLTYFILFKVFPEIKYQNLSGQDYTLPNRINQFQQLLDSVNGVRYNAWTDASSNVNIRRIAATGEEEDYDVHTYKVVISNIIAGVYTVTINGTAVIYTSQTTYKIWDIIKGLVDQVNQTTGLPVKAKVNDSKSFLVYSRRSGTAIASINVDANMTSTELVANPSILPTAFDTPAIVINQYTKISDYFNFEMVVKSSTDGVTANTVGVVQLPRLFIDETFDTNGNSTVPIHLWVTSLFETSYFEWWLKGIRSQPFWALTFTSNDANGSYLPPIPSSGFTDVIVIPSSGNTIFSDVSTFNYSRYARIIDASLPGNQVTVRSFSIQKTYVSIYDESGLAASFTGTKTVLVETRRGYFYYINNPKDTSELKKYLYTENSNTQKFFPDYKNRAGMYTNVVYAELQSATNTYRYYVKSLVDGTDFSATISIPNNAGFSKSDLLSWPIFQEVVNNVTQYKIRYCGNNTTTTSLYDSGRNDAHNTRSGLTLGNGIDMGNSFSNNAVDQNTLATLLQGCTLLSGGGNQWDSFSVAQQGIIYSLMGRSDSQTANAGAAIWLENRPLFDSINFNAGINNYASFLTNSISFVNNNYLDNSSSTRTAIQVLQKSTVVTHLVADLNPYEKILILNIWWGGSSYASGVWSQLADGINRHDYSKIFSAIKGISQSSNNRHFLIGYFMSDTIKNYYRKVHLNTI